MPAKLQREDAFAILSMKGRPATVIQGPGFGTVQLSVPSAHLSSLILAVHNASAHEVYEFVADTSVAQPSVPPFHAEIADYDRRFARTRLGLDHRPIAALTIVHAHFIVDVTFDVEGARASAWFVDANEDSDPAPASVQGASIMARRTAHALETAGVSPTVTHPTLPPGDIWG